MALEPAQEDLLLLGQLDLGHVRRVERRDQVEDPFVEPSGHLGLGEPEFALRQVGDAGGTLGAHEIDELRGATGARSPSGRPRGDRSARVRVEPWASTSEVRSGADGQGLEPGSGWGRRGPVAADRPGPHKFSGTLGPLVKKRHGSGLRRTRGREGEHPGDGTLGVAEFEVRHVPARRERVVGATLDVLLEPSGDEDRGPAGIPDRFEQSGRGDLVRRPIDVKRNTVEIAVTCYSSGDFSSIPPCGGGPGWEIRAPDATGTYRIFNGIDFKRRSEPLRRQARVLTGSGGLYNRYKVEDHPARDVASSRRGVRSTIGELRAGQTSESW